MQALIAYFDNTDHGLGWGWQLMIDGEVVCENHGYLPSKAEAEAQVFRVKNAIRGMQG